MRQRMGHGHGHGPLACVHACVLPHDQRVMMQAAGLVKPREAGSLMLAGATRAVQVKASGGINGSHHG